MNAPPPVPSPAPGDDPVERLLREHSFEPAPIPDDGFTARVLHSLPPPVAHRPTPLISLRVPLVFAGALAGLLLGWSQTPPHEIPADLLLWQDLFSAIVFQLSETVEWLGAPSQLITLASMAVALGAIYLFDDPSRDSR